MRRVLSVLILGMLITGCVLQPPRPQLSPLQTRELQTREYPTRDLRLVMKALLNVLQDEGFTTKNAVMDLGLITATREVDTEDRGAAFIGMLLRGEDADWEKNVVIEATANVSEFGNETRVRITFQKKVYSSRGRVMHIEDILDGQYYQNFLTKVDKGIFIQRERI